MANAVGLLETWMNSTVGRIESVTNTFTLVTDEVDTLKTVLVRIFVCMPPELFFFKKINFGVGGGSGGGSGWLSMHTIGLYKRELVAVVLFKNNDYCVYYYYRAEVLPINLVPFAAIFADRLLNNPMHALMCAKTFIRIHRGTQIYTLISN